jgi:hypothetical protein
MKLLLLILTLLCLAGIITGIVFIVKHNHSSSPSPRPPRPRPPRPFLNPPSSSLHPGEESSNILKESHFSDNSCKTNHVGYYNLDILDDSFNFMPMLKSKCGQSTVAIYHSTNKHSSMEYLENALKKAKSMNIKLIIRLSFSGGYQREWLYPSWRFNIWGIQKLVNEYKDVVYGFYLPDEPLGWIVDQWGTREEGFDETLNKWLNWNKYPERLYPKMENLKGEYKIHDGTDYDRDRYEHRYWDRKFDATSKSYKQNKFVMSYRDAWALYRTDNEFITDVLGPKHNYITVMITGRPKSGSPGVKLPGDPNSDKKWSPFQMSYKYFCGMNQMINYIGFDMYNSNYATDNVTHATKRGHEWGEWMERLSDEMWWNQKPVVVLQSNGPWIDGTCSTNTCNPVGEIAAKQYNSTIMEYVNKYKGHPYYEKNNNKTFDLFLIYAAPVKCTEEQICNFDHEHWGWGEGRKKGSDLGTVWGRVPCYNSPDNIDCFKCKKNDVKNTCPYHEDKKCSTCYGTDNEFYNSYHCGVEKCFKNSKNTQYILNELCESENSKGSLVCTCEPN